METSRLRLHFTNDCIGFLPSTSTIQSALVKLVLCFTVFIVFSTAAVLESNSSSPEKVEPCTVKSSFLFTKEDASPGSTLLKLPTNQGEKWTLTEDGLEGYLELDISHNDHSRIVFSKSPDIETISKTLGKRQGSLPFTLECTFNGWLYKFKQELIIHDVNEHAPVFDMNRPYNISISESSIVGSRVFSLRHLAYDPDATGRITSYSLQPFNDSKVDGRNHFRISQDGSHVILFKSIDFDELQFQGQTYFKLNLTATDNGNTEPLTSYVILTIQITDADDQGPSFIYPDCPKIDNYCTTPYFQTVIKCGYLGFLRLYPAPIQAEDRDTLNSSITYSIARVEPAQYTEKFEINPVTGAIKVVKPSCASSGNEILLTISATESSPLQHSTSTTLQIDVLDNVVIPNIAWGVDSAGDRESRPVITSKDESLDGAGSATIPLTLLLLSFFGFVTIGSVVIYIAVRSVRSRKKDSSTASTTTTINSSLEDLGDCHMCKQDFPTASTCFRSCSVKPTPPVEPVVEAAPRTSSVGSLRNKFRTFIQCSSDVVHKPQVSDTVHKPQVGPKPADLRPALMTKPQHPYHFDDNIQFRPSPSIPGNSSTSGFMNDPNASLGSMKHERGLKQDSETKVRKEDDGPENRFKLRFNNMVPEIFKANNPRVRFDTSNLNPV
ncbi:Cadherin-99C [Biomphalaria glabrata]|nr:protocadherin 18-like [Biomphalaria glabrata]